MNKGGNEKDLISDWVDCDDNVVDEIEDEEEPEDDEPMDDEADEENE